MLLLQPVCLLYIQSLPLLTGKLPLLPLLSLIFRELFPTDLIADASNPADDSYSYAIVPVVLNDPGGRNELRLSCR